MAKITVSAKEILADIKAGMDNTALMKKYGLSDKGLQSVLKKLVDAGVLKQGELEKRPSEPEKADEYVWKCSQCGKPQPKPFDQCPECGAGEKTPTPGSDHKEKNERPKVKTTLEVPDEAFLADVKAGMTYSALMEKWELSETSMKEVFKRLLDIEVLKKEELEKRTIPPLTEQLMKACFLGNVAVVKLLLDKGADINAKSENGGTVLMFASYQGHQEVVDLLKAHGAK